MAEVRYLEERIAASPLELEATGDTIILPFVRLTRFILAHQVRSHLVGGVRFCVLFVID